MSLGCVVVAIVEYWLGFRISVRCGASWGQWRNIELIIKRDGGENGGIMAFNVAQY